MKRIIKFLSIALLAIFILTGCSNHKKSDISTETGLVGKTFSVKAPVENATHGNLSIHFVDSKKAVMIESGRFEVGHVWGRLIFNLNYKISKGKTVKLYRTRAITESYSSHNDMNNHKTPIFLSESKIDKDNSDMGTIRIGKNYLGDAKNKNQRLNLIVKNDISNYDVYLKKINRKYYGKDTKLSNRGFMSPATELLSNGIAFKHSRFIWKYGGPDNSIGTNTEQGARFAVFMGNYKLEGNKLTLYLEYHTDIYQGTTTQLSDKQFQSKLHGKDIPKKLVFKFTKNNKLHLLTHFNDFTSGDMLDYGTVSGTPNYAKWIINAQPDVYNVAMEKVEKPEQTDESDENTEDDNNAHTSDDSTNSVTKVFRTKENFADWLTEYYRDKGDFATDDNPGFHVTGSYDGGTANVSDTIGGEQTETPVVYSVSYSTTTLADTDSDISRTISITNDGKIYSGHFNTLDNNLTQEYSAKE